MVSTVVGWGNEVAVNGYCPFQGLLKLMGGGNWRACVQGSALRGACSGPPTPLRGRHQAAQQAAGPDESFAAARAPGVADDSPRILLAVVPGAR